MLVEAIARPRCGAPVSVRLADVIDVLDEAYPPRLAQSWDSVGLVCGDPGDTLSSVTSPSTPRRRSSTRCPTAACCWPIIRCCCAASTPSPPAPPKGALVHRMIRTGRALFTAHTNADSASPGVSDALAARAGADRRGGAGAASVGADLDKWVIFVPRENAEAVREAMFAAGAGHIGDYSHCSWSVTGTGQFLPHDGASPAIGSVGTVERVAEDRVEVVAPARLRGALCWRRCAPRTRTRSRRSTSSRWLPLPGDVGLGRIGIAGTAQSRCAPSSPACAQRCRRHPGECARG